MQKSTLTRLFEFLIMIVMLFGWIAMLFKYNISESYELLPFNPLKYGFIILLVAMPAFMIVSPKKKFSEWLAIGMIIFGMFSLCQPFTMFLYRCGFQTLLVGTLAFIVASHS